MANKTNFPTLMKRARWDRIGVTLVILIVFIALVSSCCRSCSKKKEPDAADTPNVITPTEADPVEETSTEEETPAVQRNNTQAVFLSPSTQEDNVYACDEDVTEKSAMFKLANKVRALLEADGYTVYICEEDDTVKKKVSKGNELGCGAYVALHSNTEGETAGGTGTEVFYNSTITGSKSLAENVYNRVAELTPTEDRGIKDEEQRDLYEILNNHNACCLLEVEYHDDEDTSQWILDNMDDTAKAVKDGIEAFLITKEAGEIDDGDEPAEDEEE